MQHPDQRAPVDRLRNGRKCVVKVAEARRLVPPVAREDLVGGVAGKRHRHVLLRHLGEVVHRDGRTVGERLPMMSHDGVDHVGHRRIDDHFVMIGGVACRDHARILELTVVGMGEADREGLHGCRGLGGHSATIVELSTPPERNAPRERPPPAGA